MLSEVASLSTTSLRTSVGTVDTQRFDDGSPMEPNYKVPALMWTHLSMEKVRNQRRVLESLKFVGA